MSAEYFQILADKFIFTVKKGFLYTENETWVKIENERVRVGVTDFFQRRGGDVIYIELPQVGSTVMLSEEITQVESIKTVSSINSPVEGTIVEVNSTLTNKPEAINEDPYGKGWLVLILPSNIKKDTQQLLTAKKYFELMKKKIEDELKRSKQETSGLG
jgi:glycine cleavage system H protein